MKKYFIILFISGFSLLSNAMPSMTCGVDDTTSPVFEYFELDFERGSLIVDLADDEVGVLGVEALIDDQKIAFVEPERELKPFQIGFPDLTNRSPITDYNKRISLVIPLESLNYNEAKSLKIRAVDGCHFFSDWITLK